MLLPSPMPREGAAVLFAKKLKARYASKIIHPPIHRTLFTHPNCAINRPHRLAKESSSTSSQNLCEMILRKQGCLLSQTSEQPFSLQTDR